MQCDSRLDGQHRVTRGEDQPQHVVLDEVNGVDEVLFKRTISKHLADQLMILRCKVLAPTNLVDAATPRRCEQPGTGLARNAIARPLFAPRPGLPAQAPRRCRGRVSGA